jgi:hypothetical protein
MKEILDQKKENECMQMEYGKKRREGNNLETLTLIEPLIGAS